MNSTINTHDAFDYWTLALPVITFLLAYFITGGISWYKKRREAEEYHLFFQTYLKEQKNTNEEQVESINDQLKELSEYNSLKAVETVVQPFYLYDSIDKIKLLSSYQTLKINTSELIDELNQTELTRSIINALNKTTASHIERQEITSKDWSSTVKKFDLLFPVISKQLQLELRDSTILNRLKNLISIIPSLRESQTNSDVWLTKFYIPLKTLLKEITHEHESSSVFEIIHIISLLEFTNDSRKKELEYYKGVLNAIRVQLMELQKSEI